MRADLVGIDRDADEAINDLIMQWTTDGPSRDNGRTMVGIEFYEAIIAGRYLLAYVIDDERQRFVLMWLRGKPGVAGTPSV
jgi:hypothetical protein